VVVGAGPHALTVATHLLALDPRAADGELLVVDPSGDWLGEWRRRMAALEIPHLRSPVVHHPAPSPFGLQDFARAARRSKELHGRYQLPGVELFDDFCDAAIDEYGLAGRVVPRAARAVGADGCVHLDDGTAVTAEHVVVTHGARCPAMPSWATGSSAIHADQVDLSVAEPGSRIVIVGGGITAAHLAIAAHARGASVRIVCRSDVVEREFDSDPGWLGPKLMQEFRALHDEQRRAVMVREARGGGTIPGWLLGQLGVLSANSSCTFELLVDEVCGWDGAELALASGATIEADAVWCATGWRVDVAADGLLGPLLQYTGHRAVGGFAPLDRHLRVRSTPVHVTGPPASLVLGPSAGNLSGARRSARIIAAAVFGLERAASLGES
jgi:hypothetical protein